MGRGRGLKIWNEIERGEDPLLRRLKSAANIKGIEYVLDLDQLLWNLQYGRQRHRSTCAVSIFLQATPQYYLRKRRPATLCNNTM